MEDSVLVRDLWSGQHLKWQNGTVTAVLGGPRYQVNIDGQHSRQVHIDHLQPDVPHSTATPVDPIPEIDEAEPPPEQTDTGTDPMSIMENTLSEPLRRSDHLITPPKRLIEEID